MALTSYSWALVGSVVTASVSRLHMYVLVAVILVGILIVAVVALYLRNRQSHKTCANCGSPSQFGYSCEAESKLENIVNLCFTCLVKKMTDDYESYEGRALAIQPAAGFPCYVFQTGSRWPDSKLAKEVVEMFSATDETCNQCGSNAHYHWVSSKGLNPSTFEQVLSNGCQRRFCGGETLAQCRYAVDAA